MTEFSILISTSNSEAERQSLHFTLERLKRQDNPLFEVILMSPRLEKLNLFQAKFKTYFPIRLFNTSQLPKHINQEQGAAQTAQAEILIFLGVGTLLNPKALGFYKKQLEQYDLVYGYLGNISQFVSPSIWYPDLEIHSYDMRFHLTSIENIEVPPNLWKYPYNYAHPSNFAIKKKNFERLMQLTPQKEQDKFHSLSEQAYMQGYTLAFSLDVWAENLSITDIKNNAPPLSKPDSFVTILYDASQTTLADYLLQYALPQTKIKKTENLSVLGGRIGFILESQAKVQAAQNLYQSLFDNLPLPELTKVLYEVIKLSHEQRYLLQLCQEKILHNATLSPLEKSEFYEHLSISFQEKGDFVSARQVLETALNIYPHYLPAWIRLGMLAQEEGDTKSAQLFYTHALKSAPQNPNILVNQGIIHLAEGRLEKGFTYFESRWEIESSPVIPYQPRWQGESLQNKHLLIQSEYGLGDQIQFIRYLKNLPQGEISLETAPELLPLFTGFSQLKHVITPAQEKPDYDYAIPLLSLPLLLPLTQKEHQNQVPYLSPNISIPLPKITLQRPAIGIYWQGKRSPTGAFPYYKRLQKKKFWPEFHLLNTLQKYSDLNWYSFSKPSDSINPMVKDLSPLIQSFNDTAALLQQIDLLITIDSAIAHLAGAMDRPVWLLLSSPTYWLWPPKGSTTFWYPSMEILRQPQPGDWNGLMEILHHQLNLWLHGLNTTHG